MIELTGCTIDLDTGAVSGTPAGTLTERERRLFVYLVARPGQTVPRDELLVEVWGYSDQVVSRAVDNAVRRLREKIEVDPAHPQHLLTAFGFGYRFEPLRAPIVAAAATAHRRCVVFGTRTVDLDLGELRIPADDGAPRIVPLTGGELDVLRYLSERTGAVVDQRDLARAVGKGSVRSLHNTMYRLRAKLEPEPDEPRFLLTVRGNGYRLQLGPTAPRRKASTLVEVGIAGEQALWGAPPEEASAATARLVSWLARTAADGGGVAVGDRRFVFEEPERALTFARAIPTDAPRTLAGATLALKVALHRGHPVVWVDPVTGRASCLGAEVHRVEDLLRRAPPDGILVDAALWASLAPTAAVIGRPAGHGAVLLGDGPPLEAEPGRVALPWVGDRFLGRHAERQAVRDALSDGARLITLAGPPGVGKSRLALEVLSHAVAAGGVLHAPLGAARTPEAVVTAVAAALDVQVTHDGAGQLAHALASAPPTILWLDDCDAAAPAAGTLVERWLAEAPGLTIVATSRRALELPGEVVLVLDPLGDDDAYALFVERSARAQGPGDEPAVRALVRDLDGLPLALELAAARTAALTVAQIRDRLAAEGLKLLAGAEGRSRHRSVRAALDVSWELLDPHERTALARCAVFRGGFALDVADAVLESQEPGAPWVVDLLEALVRHHLLRVEDGRYAMLDSVRAYAAERLDTRAREQAEIAHGRAHATLGSREAIDRLSGPDAREARRALMAEVQNLELALERAAERGDAEVAAGTALALAELRARRGPYAVGVTQVDRALALPGCPRQAELRIARGWIGALAGDAVGSVRDLEAAITTAEREKEPILEALARFRLGAAILKRASPETRAGHFRRALALVGEDRSPLAQRVEGLAMLHLAGTLPQRERILAEEEALASVRRLGDEELEGQALGALGLSERARGRNARARELTEAALAIHRKLGDRRYEAFSLANLANSLRYEDPGAAQAYVRAAIALQRQNGGLHGEAAALGTHAGLLFDAGDHEAARSAMHAAVDMLVRVGATDIESLYRSNLGVILNALGREREAEEQLARALALAEGLGDEERIASAAFALSTLWERRADALSLLDQAERGLENQREHLLHIIARRGLVLHALGDPDAARVQLGRAEGLIADLPASYPDDGPALFDLRRLRQRLGSGAADRRAVGP